MGPELERLGGSAWALAVRRMAIKDDQIASRPEFFQ